MTQRDDVLRILARRPDGMTDAEVARELKRLHPKAVHQTANIICRRLADEGVILRDTADSPILNRLPDGAPAPERPAPAPHKPWPWEGAVQHLISDWLTGQSGRVISQADTATKQRGTDIVAELDGRRVHVEVKGWPSREYSDPRRAGEVKPTQPSVQANQWFAGALSSALKLRHAHPGDRVALAFPDFPRYRTLHLHSERSAPLRSLGIEMWLVAESGAVEIVDAAVELPDGTVTSDSAAQRRHRAHQSWWRRDVLGLPAGPPSAQVRAKYPTLGNYLPESHAGLTADQAGWNLMSDAARDYTHRRLAVVARTEGLAETDRLWRNMLSSQPLAFSIAGELRAHPKAAVALFAELTGLSVVGLDRLGEPGDDYLLDGIEAEWSPPREHHTGDRSGFDIAAMLRLEDGTRVLVSIEVKYVDSFSSAPLDPERYRGHLTALGLDDDATAATVDRGGSQYLRSVLLTESVRRSGLRRESGVDRCLSVVLARHDDTTADDVVQTIAEHAPAAEVARWSHHQLLRAAAGRPELAEWARRTSRRYLP